MILFGSPWKGSVCRGAVSFAAGQFVVQFISLWEASVHRGSVWVTANFFVGGGLFLTRYFELLLQMTNGLLLQVETDATFSGKWAL